MTVIDGTSRSTPATTAPTRPSPGASQATSPGISAGTPSGVGVCTAAPSPHPRPTGRDSYTISEVVARTGLTAHTLRWYERIGLMPHVDRSHTGQRRFTNRDLDWLAFVGKLRMTGMPVADMVRYAELLREGESTVEARRELLEATRRDVIARIAELHDTLAVLDHKIEFYAGARRAPERHSA